MIARSIGAAPRQRGSSEGWTFSIGSSESSGSRISWPKAQTATASGRAARIRSSAASSLTFSRLQQLEPQLARAATAAGGGCRPCGPAPGGRSGGVTTSGRPVRRAGERAAGPSAANSEVPR